ncbi:MAG TPA: D-alanyl-D-alanine carboxypeptidase [Solirubrobacteraceae bacterium]|nr:D-alanyl-D-alanine carboxypeptidase [Solirubrobacteraceae bacterium]
MRSAATLAITLTLAVGLASSALARTAATPSARVGRAPNTPAERTLVGALNRGMRQAGSYSGAYVVDLTTAQALYSHNANTGRLPASVEKLYTTTTALQRFGGAGSLTTAILGNGQLQGHTYVGTLYLRGGGDPTFGAASFDAANYGTGATMQQLVSQLVSSTGITTVRGTVVADETMFDADRGTPATNNQPSTEVEGELTGLAYDRGWANVSGNALDAHPALDAGLALVGALRAAGVKVATQTPVRSGLTPAGAAPLAEVSSPPMASLLSLTNTPSDNFFGEMLLKDIGARFGAGGTTAAGAAIVRAQMAAKFGIHPRLNDGSGLSRYDLTTPVQVVTLLRAMAGTGTFTRSLAVAGETGTLQDEMRATYAQGRCRGKTGTLSDVSNVVGYCQARDGHTLAYAVMMNGVYPFYAHPIQNRMVVSIAKYGG